MSLPISSQMETDLVLTRENILEKLEDLFKGKAIESHLFGSVARRETDAFSDIDIWFTFNDEGYDEIYTKRFEYYKKLGEIIHLCEAPQNAPINGVHTALLIRSSKNLLVVVDIYLCPLRTAYITEEGRKLYGVDLPLGTIGFNPKKVQVDADYRIDFFIGFIFNSIKKLVRCEENPLESLLREYGNLHSNYNIPVEELTHREQVLETLEKVVGSTEKVANERQKKALTAIRDFMGVIFN